MNFLFPLFMLGAAAVAVPILLHFRRQPPQKSVHFSSLMFLEPSPVPPVTRRKLEDWLLLALRCLAILLLALMFARPFFRAPAFEEAPPGAAWCILLDVSASMQREPVWTAAMKRIDETISKIREQDAVSLVTFDTRPQVVLGQDAWRSLPEGGRLAALRHAVTSVRPGWKGTDLGQALVFAAGLASDGGASAGRKHQIVLISDLQEGAGLDALHAASWPENVIVSAVPVEGPWRDNFTLASAALLRAEEGSSPVAGQAGGTLGTARVRVTSSREAKLDRFVLAWEEGGVPVEANVPAGGTRTLSAPSRTMGEANGVLVLKGDTLEFDNRLYVARSRPRDVRVLCLGRDLSRTVTSSPLFYLVRALHPTPALAPVLEEKTFEKCTGADLATADLVFVFGEADAPSSSGLLREWVQGGGSLVYLAQSGDVGTSLAAVLGEPEVRLGESTSGDALLQDLQFDHPVLRSFAEAGVRDFTKIRFWKRRSLEMPPALFERIRVIARFDDLTPAWMEIPSGRGKVLAMMSGWTPEESQFAVSSKFLPVVHAMLDWAVGGGRSEGAGLHVGDPIAATQGNWRGIVPVSRPDGQTVSWNVETQPLFAETGLPGFYQVGEGAASQSIAVNLAPGEGRLAPMDPSRLAEFGVVLDDSHEASSAGAEARTLLQQEDARQEQGQKIWKNLLVAALLVLLLETVLAGRREGLQGSKATQLAS